VIPVEHLNSNITNHEGRQQYLEYWEKFTGTPTVLKWPPEKLKAYSKWLLWSLSEDHLPLIELNIKWKDGKEAEALASILGRLKIPAVEPQFTKRC
jgi:hypothetical protein